MKILFFKNIISVIFSVSPHFALEMIVLPHLSPGPGCEAELVILSDGHQGKDGFFPPNIWDSCMFLLHCGLSCPHDLLQPIKWEQNYHTSSFVGIYKSVYNFPYFHIFMFQIIETLSSCVLMRLRQKRATNHSAIGINETLIFLV